MCEKPFQLSSRHLNVSISICALNMASYVGYMALGAGERFQIHEQDKIIQEDFYSVEVSVRNTLPISPSFFLKTMASESVAPPSVFTEDTRMSETS